MAGIFSGAKIFSDQMMTRASAANLLNFRHIRNFGISSANLWRSPKTPNLVLPYSRPMPPETSFEETALPFLTDLFRTAVRSLGDRSAAEDCVQETYLQAQKSFHRFEPGTNCRAWMFKILMHVIQHHRRKWFRMTPADMEVLLSTTAAPERVPEHLTDEDILDALDQIPTRFRDVVLLADVEELSYKEISEALNIPIGTVMSRLSRGRSLLRGKLAGQFRAPSASMASGRPAAYGPTLLTSA